MSLLAWTDERWYTLRSGYRDLYNPSDALQALEQGDFTLAWDELWENLHHHGDVDTAAYATVPEIVRIASNPNYFTFISQCGPPANIVIGDGRLMLAREPAARFDLIGKRFAIRGGRLLVIYVLGYAIGRFWVEGLRIDPANSGGGWRLNQWTAFVAGLLAAGYLLVDWLRHRHDEPVAGAGAADDTTDADATDDEPIEEGTDAAEDAGDDVEVDAPTASGDEAAADYLPEDD